MVRPMRPHPICATFSVLLGASAPSTDAGMIDGNASAEPEAAAPRKKSLLPIFICIISYLRVTVSILARNGGI